VIHLCPLADIDPTHVELLLDAAFGADRRGRTAYRMREGVDAIGQLSFAALDGGTLVGSIQCWPVALLGDNGDITPITLAGPVAVDPEMQRGGIGRMLMAHMLDAAQAHDVKAMMMIGDPEYYERFFGFSSVSTQYWQIPGPVERHRLLARCNGAARLPTRGRIIPHRAFATEPATA
jgi:predicted N-acetyltransferase YhbS